MSIWSQKYPVTGKFHFQLQGIQLDFTKIMRQMLLYRLVKLDVTLFPLVSFEYAKDICNSCFKSCYITTINAHMASPFKAFLKIAVECGFDSISLNSLS